MNNALEIRLLGDFVLRQNGRIITDLDSPRIQALLAYLLLHRGAPQLRQHLAFLFWPDSDEKQARTNLRNLLHRLRQTWPRADDYLAIETKSLTWRNDTDFWLDVAAFEHHLAQAETAVDPTATQSALQQAIDLYHHSLLPGCYDDWIIPERDRLRRAFLAALEQQATFFQDAGDYQAAIRQYRQLSRAEPLQESYYRHLMQLYSQAGDRAAALRVYYRCATTLRRELDVVPAAATQAAYRQLLGLEGPLSQPVPDTPAATSLVGRHFEWEQLHAFWQQTAAGTQPPSLGIISGEAGIGKSKLAEEFVTWVRRQGGTTAVAACYAPETTISFAPVASWLRGLSLEKLGTVWQTELARLLPELAPPDQPLTPPPPLSEAWQKQRFYEALTQAILSQKQPICLQLEDIQWSDPETLAWLHYLLRRDEQARLFILTTHRQEEAENEPLRSLLLQWRQQGRLLAIDLARLDESDSTDLAATIFGQPLPAELAATLYRYTEGNPLFIVETVRSSLEQDWHAGGQADPIQLLAQLLPADDTAAAPLPPKILAVIRARLGQLSATAQRAMEAATVIGRSFTIDKLLQVSGIEEDELVTAVDELWQRRIVRDREGNAYDFSHDKLRQVAYQAIMPARRRWLHGRLAQTLTALETSQSEPLAGRIAFHYEAAGQIEKALVFHQKAAAEARLVYAAQEEAYHLQRAIALQGPAEAGRLVPLYEQLGHAYATLGRQDEGRQAYQAALALVPAKTTTRAALTLNLANTWLSQYDLQQAGQLFAEVTSMLGDATGYTQSEWSIWLDARLAQFDVAYYAANLAQMEAVITETEALIEKHGSLTQRILFHQKQAQLHSRQTRFRHTAEGVAYTRAALRLAQETGDEQRVHASQFGLGFMLLWQVQPEPAAAVTMLEKAAAGSRETGNVPLLDRCLAYLTMAYRLQGDEERLHTLLPQSRAVAESEENSLYVAVAQAHLAWLAARAERWSEAAAEAQTALAQWQKLVFPFHWLACWPYLAAAVHQGDLATAVAQAQAMLAPEQHQLPAELEAALITAVSNPTTAHFQKALNLAQQHNLL